jgi:hypothetical protein
VNQEFLLRNEYLGQSCKLRANGFFCQLSSPALKDFNTLKSSATYPADALLFLEKQDARGVFVLCRGQSCESPTPAKSLG